jgi:hypothetical protein
MMSEKITADMAGLSVFSRMTKAAVEVPKTTTTSGARSISSFGSNKAPEIFHDPHGAVNQELGNDSLLRIMRESKVRVIDKLIMLAEKGDVQGLEHILEEEGASLKDCKGLHGFTPLHHACSRSQSAAVSILIKHGSNINEMNHAGESPLHLAAYAGNLLVVEQLLDCGASIDAVNNDGETALFYAARQAKPAVARLLLQRGANSDLKDTFGDLAVDQADDLRTKDVLTNFGTVVVTESAQGSQSKFNSLPYTELLHIFRFLSVKEVCRAAQVSGKWHRVSETEDIWRSLGIRRWELALQSSLGFETSAATAFARPSKSTVKKKPPSR